MSTVLLAVRDAVEASRSIQCVVDRARRDAGCTVVVLHVHETAVDRLGPYHVDDEQSGECIAESVATVLAQQGIAARPMSVERPEGTVAETLAAVAEEVGAHVIVVGAVAGWCRPEVATAAHVSQLVDGRTTVQTIH